MNDNPNEPDEMEPAQYGPLHGNSEGDPVELEPDEPPKSGVFVEHDEIELTRDEIAEGDRLGRVIDPDDDEDTGLELDDDGRPS